jgi:hypothetical protein
LANPSDVESLRDKLRVGKGTLVDRWLSTTDDYFRGVLHVNPLDPAHLDYLRGIDFHRPVTVEPLRPGALLIRFPEILGGTVQVERPKPYRFFAKPGGTPLHLGWNMDEMGYQLFQLRQPVQALVSSASAIRFRDTRSRLGGDTQVVVPWSTSVMLIRAREFDRQKMAEMWRAGYLPLGLP